jgi:hypothetical protein
MVVFVETTSGRVVSAVHSVPICDMGLRWVQDGGEHEPGLTLARLGSDAGPTWVRFVYILERLWILCFRHQGNVFQ